MSKADTLLKKAAFYEKMALYSDRKSFLKALAQTKPIMEGEKSPNPLLRPYGGSEAGDSWEAERAREFGTQPTIPRPQPLTPQEEAAAGMSGPADVTFQPDQIRVMAPIDAQQQSALGKFVTVNGLAFVDPKKMHDGKLGPETRKALDAFKKYLTEKNPAKPHMSDKDALQTAKFIVDNDPARYGTA